MEKMPAALNVQLPTFNVQGHLFDADDLADRVGVAEKLTRGGLADDADFVRAARRSARRAMRMVAPSLMA